MQFRKAMTEDLESVMSIVAETVVEMQRYGNLQWDAQYPDRARFQQDVASEALYVVDFEGEVTAFVTVDEVQPDGYAGLNWSRNTPPLVVHRLAVSTARRGAGVASFLEQSICDLARHSGHDHLRVDTYSTNTAMQAFLLKRGYISVGEMSYRGRELPFYCYEKPLS
ncbi:N-acetyltransferase [Capsulimonas corticalis]|uniref:N-acetyltransferase n=1 Tax=Capsulimonas corticalis TaxID=2219043 RepID=A0A402CXA7_9BACT|nr:GNAT family N-acetyltransferase [Capsulimonas corticalis]BDI32345.1 N-acetyltransferase [Capsulimonas corticalis]